MAVMVCVPPCLLHNVQEQTFTKAEQSLTAYLYFSEVLESCKSLQIFFSHLDH